MNDENNPVLTGEVEPATQGRGWRGDPEGHAAAGRKGGQVVSHDRDHMAAIGRKGGQTVSRDREHMAKIGAVGGKTRRATP
jgi:uncharacterized protein